MIFFPFEKRARLILWNSMEKNMYRVYIITNIMRMQDSADHAMYSSRSKIKLPDKVIDNQNMVDKSTPAMLQKIFRTLMMLRNNV